MSRLGYLITLVLIILLIGYLVWPEESVQYGRLQMPGMPPEQLTVATPAYTQQRDGDRVAIAGFQRPLDEQQLQKLWTALQRMRLDPQRQASVAQPADRARLYGLDGSWSLRFDEQEIRWSLLDRDAYVWQSSAPGIVHRIATERAAAAQGAAQRLDQRALQPDLPREVSQLSIDDQDFQVRRSNMHWYGGPHPAPVTTRMIDLLKAIGHTPATTFGHTVPDVAADHELSATLRSGEDADTASLAIRLWLTADSPTLAIAGQPPQRLAEGRQVAISEALRALEVPLLTDLHFGMQDLSLQRVVVTRGGEPWFRLEREGLQDVVEGRSAWQVVWSGGRERARSNAANEILAAVNAIEIADMREAFPRPAVDSDTIAIELASRADLMQEPPTSSTVIIDPAADSPAGVAWAYGIGGVHRDLPDALARLAPDFALERTLLDVEAARIDRFQRQRHSDEPLAQEFERTAGGWQQRYPQRRPTTDDGIARLLRHLVHIEATDVRFATDADRALLQAPDAEFDVHLHGSDIHIRQDVADIDDTLARNWGIALLRDDGLWRAVSKTGSLAYTLRNEDVAPLFAPLSERPLLPMPASLVVGMRWEGERRFIVERVGDAWEMRLTGQEMPVDENQIRRFLDALGSATYADTSDLSAGDAAERGDARRLELLVQTALGVEELTLVRLGPKRLLRSAAAEDLQLEPTVLQVDPAVVSSLFPDPAWFRRGRDVLESAAANGDETP